MGETKKTLTIEAGGAVASIVQVLADAFNDYERFAANGSHSAMEAMVQFSNLLPDIADIVARVPSLPGEIANLDIDDIAALANQLASKLQLPNTHAQAILNAVLPIISNLVATGQSIIGLYQVIRAPA